MVEGDRRVSLSKIMSTFSLSAREHSSLNLRLILLEFQNRTFKLFILRRDYGQVCFYCCFNKCYQILIVIERSIS